jgi:hypothetical protein
VPRNASPAAIRRASLHAALLGLLWAYVPAAWFAGADPPHQLLIATPSSGMMCAGAFTLATVPTASLTYVGLLGAGSAYALATSHEVLYVPELGTIGPAEFIPIAEDCGLIGEIGNWALQQACKEAITLPYRQRPVGARQLAAAQAA